MAWAWDGAWARVRDGASGWMGDATNFEWSFVRDPERDLKLDALTVEDDMYDENGASSTNRDVSSELELPPRPAEGGGGKECSWVVKYRVSSMISFSRGSFATQAPRYSSTISFRLSCADCDCRCTDRGIHSAESDLRTRGSVGDLASLMSAAEVIPSSLDRADSSCRREIVLRGPVSFNVS